MTPRLLSKIFQLTSSRRGWRVITTSKMWKQYFNSHPHEEDDLAETETYNEQNNISTHILTKRMTKISVKFESIKLAFQLTSSRRGWPRNVRHAQTIFYFNSHPHEEDDDFHSNDELFTGYFNSHPHEEDDRLVLATVIIRKNISTHILTKRMTFQPWVNGIILRLFQLTSSRRGWPDCDRVYQDAKDFNSHPHEEDDGIVRFILHEEHEISTHILTKRMTPWLHIRGNAHYISTHILTKRMTAILNKNNLFKIAYYISNKHFISIVDIFFHFHIYF